MNYILVEYTGYLVGIAAIIGLIRIRQLDQAYYPFVLVLWFGTINEILTTIVVDRGFSNALNSNIYVLIEALLIVWFIYNHGVFRGRRGMVFLICSMLILSWSVEAMIFTPHKHFSSYFGAIYSFTIVILSVTLINQLLESEKKSILRHPAFIIAIGFLLFYTCNIIVEIFYLYGLEASKEKLVGRIYSIIPYVNLLVNLIYIFALLWIPRKQKYTLL